MDWRIPMVDLESEYADVGDALEESVLRVLRSRRFVLGPECEALERELADRVGAGFAVTVASGSDALTLSLQAVGIEGGVAANVVPDRASVTLNHRFAPDRTPDEAEAAVRAVVEPVLEDGDRLERVDMAPAAAPALDHPLLAALIERNGLEVRAKLGWTDVARFSAHGVPAANFGPGEATIAHTADERIDRAPLERTAAALLDLLTNGV